MSVEVDRCWCGTENPISYSIPGGCGRTGSLRCRCGGDQCYCHNHGEQECHGCDDCDGDEWEER